MLFESCCGEEGHEKPCRDDEGRELPLKKEAVDHPSHYGGDVEHEHIKCITAWGIGYRLGQASKYIYRMGKKGLTKQEMIEDLEKAIWYIQSKIKLLKEDRDQIQS